MSITCYQPIFYQIEKWQSIFQAVYVGYHRPKLDFGLVVCTVANVADNLFHKVSAW